MVKLRIIGLGKMGGYHATIAASLPNVELVGVSDPITKNLEKITLKNCIKSTDYNTWINLVDAVIIAVPTGLHFNIAKDCLLKNKSILIEKPLTKTLTQAEELFAIAHERNLGLHVGHVERFNGAVQELKKIINKPYFIESHRIGPFAPRVQDDTVILDLMIHDLDIILNLVGSPVVKFNVLGTTLKSELCDLATVQLYFENGAIAHLISSRASQIKKRTMVIHQEDAFIELDFTTQDILIHRHASASVKIGNNELHYRQEGTIERIFVYKENPLKAEIEHFINAIKTGSKLIQPQQDLDALKLTLALEEMVLEGNNKSPESWTSTGQKPLLL